MLRQLVTPLITLLTDFGTRDPFVGVMKGVIASHVPEARCIDLTHQVPPQDVQTAGFWLAHAHRAFPTGRVHLVVVDPGVGSKRRGLGPAAK